SFLSPTMTSTIENVERLLMYLAAYTYHAGAEMLGIHQEGPFISKKQPGAQHPHHILAPDVEMIRRLQDISGNRIRQITFAPEEDENGTFLEALKELGIIASAGHTDALYETLIEAEKNGVSHVTH